jgi:hypothetical protein
MELVNRGSVVIKPRQPFVDWVNRTASPERSVSIEELSEDSTVILVPDMGGPGEVQEFLEPLKPLLFDMELEVWNLDEAAWPPARSGPDFDAWFDLEIHSLVWDSLDEPLEKEGGEGIANLTGTWRVVDSPDLDEEYLYIETAPHFSLHQRDVEIGGDFHIGLMRGSVHGRLEGSQVLFSFEGSEGLDPVRGAGTIVDAGEWIVVKMLFHGGEIFTFDCELAEDEGE